MVRSRKCECIKIVYFFVNYMVTMGIVINNRTQTLLIPTEFSLYISTYIPYCKVSDKSIEHVKYNIPHIRQQFNWDCGISCVLMLLSQKQRDYFEKSFFQICLEEGFGTSTWTIDLCYLLKRFQISHRMHTARQAANRKSCGSVSKITIKDADRVQNRFKNASSNGIDVVVGVFSTQKLIAHVTTNGPAIVLVDASLLSCDLCKHNKFASELRSMFGGTYNGHYVLVVGNTGKLLFHDPARNAPVCVAPAHKLHAARRAYGTDYDVILIYNKH